MLSVEAPFPQNDSRAFVRTTAEAVRIVRRNPDGTAFVIRTGLRPAEKRASDSFTIPLSDLFETAKEAEIMPPVAKLAEAKPAAKRAPRPARKPRASRPRKAA